MKPLLASMFLIALLAGCAVVPAEGPYGYGYYEYGAPYYRYDYGPTYYYSPGIYGGFSYRYDRPRSGYWSGGRWHEGAYQPNTGQPSSQASVPNGSNIASAGRAGRHHREQVARPRDRNRVAGHHERERGA